MKKSPLIYLILWAVFVLIGISIIVLQFYMKEKQLFNFLGVVSLIIAGFILSKGSEKLSMGDHLTKKQIKTNTRIYVDSKVGDTIVPDYSVPVFVMGKQIFLIQLENEEITLLREDQNLEEGQKYTLDHKGMWQQVNQISVKEKIYEASHQ